MGAQAAALLAAARDGAPLGDVPAASPPDGTLRLSPPPHWDLAGTALLHGGVGLAPTAWDGATLHVRLPQRVRVHPDLRVDWWEQPPEPAVLRRVLGLDDDLQELWDACDAVPQLAGLRPRVLRSPTVWQDLVGALAGTRASYRSTQAMLRRLVDGGAFPAPEQVLDRDLRVFGSRAGSLRALAARVAGGWDPEQLLRTSDEDAAAQVRALTGFGPFATAQVLPLLGRPRPPVLDGWLRDRAEPGWEQRLAPLGRWAGTGLWLEAASAWLRPAPPAPPSHSCHCSHSVIDGT